MRSIVDGTAGRAVRNFPPGPCFGSRRRIRAGIADRNVAGWRSTGALRLRQRAATALPGGDAAVGQRREYRARAPASVTPARMQLDQRYRARLPFRCSAPRAGDAIPGRGRTSAHAAGRRMAGHDAVCGDTPSRVDAAPAGLDGRDAETAAVEQYPGDPACAGACAPSDPRWKAACARSGRDPGEGAGRDAHAQTPWYSIRRRSTRSSPSSRCRMRTGVGTPLAIQRMVSLLPPLVR